MIWACVELVTLLSCTEMKVLFYQPIGLFCVHLWALYLSLLSDLWWQAFKGHVYTGAVEICLYMGSHAK